MTRGKLRSEGDDPEMIVYRGRCYCVLSTSDFRGVPACRNTACDRFVTEAVEQAAHRQGLPIDMADLRTSKCGYTSGEPLEAA